MPAPDPIDWNSPQRHMLTRAALRRGGEVVFTLAGVRHLSADDLKQLADLADLVRERGRKVRILDAAATVRLLLEVTRLDRVLLIGEGDGPEPQGPDSVVPMPPKGPKRLTSLLSLALLAIVVSACSTPRNTHVEPTSLNYMAEKQLAPKDALPRCPAAGAANARVETAPGTDGLALQSPEPLHGPGDELQVDIAEGEDFSGVYTVNFDGRITLPHASPVTARGATDREVAARVTKALVAAGLFRKDQVKVSVRTLKWAPAHISISGAVFLPGRAMINQFDRNKEDPDAADSVGDAPVGRFLDAGLRGGAGVRPDADLANIMLERGGRTYRIDMSGVVTGAPVPDVPLMAGDSITVPSTGCFQSALVRPSQVTPAGIRVFMSNLTQPAVSNNASAVERYATNVPYGTRLLQGAISSNCVGGAETTNAGRSVVLVSVNPLTGRTEVIERSVEALVNGANRDEVNPYLMPNDAIACYDSGVTNAREAARALGEILSPLGILLTLL